MIRIIAEIASCHNGDVSIAKQMICAADDCGVNIVKFQSWQAKNVDPKDPDRKRYENLELSDEAHIELKDFCKKRRMEFLTTVFDIDRIPFLKDTLGLKKIKIASFDCKNVLLVAACRANFDEVIISTGQSTFEEIQQVVDSFRNSSSKLVLLHCVSSYPCMSKDVNMNKMLELKKFKIPVGYSDHTLGAEAAIMAISLGAVYVEKHFTLDRNTPQELHSVSANPNIKLTTTHRMACEPDIFKKICHFRDFAEVMRGGGGWVVSEEELDHRKKYTGRLDGSWKKNL